VAVINVRRQGHNATGVKLPAGLSLTLLVLVICQAAFGAWTVTLKLWPQVVTAHLLGGFATLSLLWLLSLRLGVLQQLRVPGHLLPHAALALAAVVIQVALGGWVSSNYAALACHDFPTCHGAWWPAMNLAEGFNVAQAVGPNYLGGQLENDARVAIQFVHRLGAVVVLAAVGLLAWRLYRARSALALPVAVILGLQLALGVMNVVLVLPLWVATAHNAGGALLLLALVTVNYRAFRHGRRA
jgi:cytochrome c oxidase assembly protein subunit 15